VFCSVSKAWIVSAGTSAATDHGQGLGCARVSGCGGAEPALTSRSLLLGGLHHREKAPRGTRDVCTGELELHPIPAPHGSAPSSPSESLWSGGRFSCGQCRIRSEPVPSPVLCFSGVCWLLFLPSALFLLCRKPTFSSEATALPPCTLSHPGWPY